MDLWRRFRRAPVRRDDDSGPELVGDVWTSRRSVQPATWSQVAGWTWRRRFERVAEPVRKAAGWLTGVEVRSGEQQRAITSVPWDQGGPRSPSAISEGRALQLAPVYAAGRLLCSNLASLPVQVYRESGGVREKLPLPSLFVNPSVNGTLHDWTWRAVASLVYRGNAIGLITATDYLEQPTQVEWLNPDWVQVEDQNPYGRGSFTNPVWRVLGVEVEAEDLVHIPWMTLPGRVWGLSPMEAFAAAVRTGLSAQDYTTDWFESGGVPPGTFKNTQQTVDQKDAAVIKARLMEAIRTRQPIVYGRDWDFTALTISASEAKFVETMQLSASQIAAIYGIPPEMIGGTTGGTYTYTSADQRQLELIQSTLLPWMTKLDSHFTALLPRGQYVKLNADATVRVDIVARFAAYEKARMLGIMCVDEIRALEDLPPLPNGEGQDYTPLLVAVAEARHGEVPALLPAPVPAPAPNPVPAPAPARPRAVS